jgi:hypothetical protein
MNFRETSTHRRQTSSSRVEGKKAASVMASPISCD